MKKILHLLEVCSSVQLKYVVTLIALLIASQMQYIQHGWINSDSVLYLESAKFFSKGEWQAGFEVFNWPLYSLCIALVNTVTSLGVHLSAQILNVLFYGIATYSFIQLIELAGGKQREIIAGAMIWLSAQYIIGGVLEMLMRDEGFWAFFLLGIVYFLRFYQTNQLKEALLWQFCILIATFFRIEALTYLILLPIILVTKEARLSRQTFTRFFLANALHLTLVLLLLATFVWSDHLSSKFLGRFNEIFTVNIWNHLTRLFIEKSTVMSNQVLGEYLDEFAVGGLILTLVLVLVTKTIQATGVINVIFSAIAIQQNKQLIRPDAFRVLYATALIAVLNMALIVTKVFVLSGRYVLALSFILMILAAFSFAKLLFNDSQSLKLKLITMAIVVFMCLGAIKNIVPKSEGYNFLQDAVVWVNQKKSVNEYVYYDDPRMVYFAGGAFTTRWNDNLAKINNDIQNKSIFKFHYVLVSTHDNKQQSPLQNLANFHEIRRFYDKKKKKSVVIYQNSAL